tara:strand:- start:101 stop:544 length:444 start_codon:yes stop_codon:yes gene_type:complete
MALVPCKYCGAKISEKAIYCPKCGKSTIAGSINIFNAYLKLWTKAFKYDGLTIRKEFWFGQLAAQIINSLFLILIVQLEYQGYRIEEIMGIVIPFFIHIIGSSIASISSVVRRFRDTSTKPIGAILFFIPIFGQIYVYAVCCQRSKR